MNAKDAVAITVHKPRRRLNVDERVAIWALVLLAVALVYGTNHREPQVVSCYQPERTR